MSQPAFHRQSSPSAASEPTSRIPEPNEPIPTEAENVEQPGDEEEGTGNREEDADGSGIGAGEENEGEDGDSDGEDDADADTTKPKALERRYQIISRRRSISASKSARIVTSWVARGCIGSTKPFGFPNNRLGSSLRRQIRHPRTSTTPPYSSGIRWLFAQSRAQIAGSHFGGTLKYLDQDDA